MLLSDERREQLQADVAEHAARLRCEFKQEDNLPGMMWVEYEPPYIEGPTIYKPSDYMIMLHELGHVANGHTQGRPPFTDKTWYFDNGVLRSEAEAWEWALDHHILHSDEWTRELHDYMWIRCMGSYLMGAVYARGNGGQRLGNGDRGYVAFRYDEPDEYFWEIAEQLYGDKPVVQIATYKQMKNEVMDRGGFAARLTSAV